MNRWKNYILWVAMGGLLGMFLLDVGLLKDLTRFDEYINKILYILVLAGIINNPSIGKGFKDEDEL